MLSPSCYGPTCAVTVDALGRKEEAEQLYRYQLDHYMQVCGPRHHYTLMSMSNLGAWLMNNGHQREAEQLIDRCWKLQCEVLGDDHPETLMSMQNLSSVLTNLGRAKEAVAIGEDLLELSRRVHGAYRLADAPPRRNPCQVVVFARSQRRSDHIGTTRIS